MYALLLGAVAGYALTVLNIRGSWQVSERTFEDRPRDDGVRLDVYIEILAVDAVNDSLRLRLTLSADAASRGTGAANRDLTVRLENANVRREVALRAGSGMAVETIEIDLDGGTVAAFPLDRFRTELHLAARDASAAAVPLRVTAWEGIAGWTPAVTRSATTGAPGDVGLRFDLRRSAALRLLVLAVYGEMAMIGLAALTIGCRTFLGLRPAESTLTGSLTGMVFSLPALRYALPGSVPLGVRADLLVFFWAELAVALGFLLFIIAWARVRVKS